MNTQNAVVQNSTLPFRKAYDIETFCKIFSVGRTLVYAEIKAGRLKIAKVGRRTIIPAYAADEWLQSRMSQS